MNAAEREAAPPPPPSSMDGTPVANRARIAFFGRRNAGKSALVNAIASQRVSIVSDVPGTTTDPVSKTMEILPLGPCVLTDTAGLDDDAGELGAKRVERTLATLAATDVAVLAVPCGEEFLHADLEVLAECRRRGIAAVIARTKCDLANAGAPSANGAASAAPAAPATPIFRVSAATGEGIDALRAGIAAALPSCGEPPLFAGLVQRGDIVVLVCPQDAAAPKGRLILPQQQAVRELLETRAVAVVCRTEELRQVFAALGPSGAKLAVVDSQVFAEADAATPPEVPLTSFSILFARRKGDIAAFCEGADAISRLRDGDLVLVAEGCTHRRQCGDIGTVKIPRMLERLTGKRLRFVFSSGGDFPLDGAERPALVVHCGGCMLSRRQVLDRIARCRAAGVPVVNYGVALARACGITTDPATCLAGRCRK